QWRGRPITGTRGSSCASARGSRMGGFPGLLALPSGPAAAAAAAVVGYFHELPAMLRASLAWAQGSEMAQHANVSLATSMPVYFADPPSPWQRPSYEHSNRLTRESLPEEAAIPVHLPYRTTLAEEPTSRPRRRADLA